MAKIMTDSPIMARGFHSLIHGLVWGVGTGIIRLGEAVVGWTN